LGLTLRIAHLHGKRPNKSDIVTVEEGSDVLHEIVRRAAFRCGRVIGVLNDSPFLPEHGVLLLIASLEKAAPPSDNRLESTEAVYQN
jgi:hypothetical protein